MHTKLRIMDPGAQLLDLYQQWKNLTEQEGAGILASNWVEVRRCQRAKSQLQPQIIRVSDQLKNNTQLGSSLEVRVRECVNELIELESRNSASLAGRLQAARSEKDNLDRTSNRLRQLHKSYVPPQGAPLWNQYS